MLWHVHGGPHVAGPRTHARGQVATLGEQRVGCFLVLEHDPTYSSSVGTTPRGGALPQLALDKSCKVMVGSASVLRSCVHQKHYASPARRGLEDLRDLHRRLCPRFSREGVLVFPQGHTLLTWFHGPSITVVQQSLHSCREAQDP